MKTSNQPLTYKIVTPALVNMCKSDETLAQLVEQLPDVLHPMHKGRRDIAFSVDYLCSIPKAADRGKAIRETFKKTSELTPVVAVMKNVKANSQKIKRGKVYVEAGL
jgi:hypothetical protein